MTSFEFFDRCGRPLLRVLCVFVVFAIGAAIAFAYINAAMTHASVPDMSGGLSAIATTLIPLAIDQVTRSSERHAQIARGQAPGPFAGSDSASGARPGENRP